MKVVEIHPEGSYDGWDGLILEHFRESEPTTNVGQQLVFENESLKVWAITLAPSEALPFHKHTRNYNWTTLTQGTALSYYETGRVVEITYQKGDISYYDHEKKGDFIHNLINTGNQVLEFVTVEYKE